MALRSFLDGSLFAEVFGEDPPTVLALHGWGRRGRDFALCLDGLPSLAPDLPGFGASPPPSTSMGADGYAEVLDSVMPVFESPPVIVGHSFGGRVAVCLASRRPESVRGLVLTGVPLLRRGSTRRPTARYRLLRAANRLRLLPDRRMEEIRRRSGSADYRAASGVMRDILVRVVNESYPEQLSALRCEVRLVWGSEDREVPSEVAHEAAGIINRGPGRAEVEVVAGAGHLLPLEAPDSLRRAIDSLLG